MNVTTVGIDLTKNVFSVHSVDAHGEALQEDRLARQAARMLRQSATQRDQLVHAV